MHRLPDALSHVEVEIGPLNALVPEGLLAAEVACSARSQLGTQRVSALRFADPWVQAIFGVLALFCLLPCGFTNREFRERLAPLLGLPVSAMTPGRPSW